MRATFPLPLANLPLASLPLARFSPVALFALLLAGGCDREADDPYFKVVPGSYILVETFDFDKPELIMLDVNQWLALQEEARRLMLSHGSVTPTSYGFKFKGKCAQNQKIFLEVRQIIRKHTNALVVCTDTPPDPEPDLPPADQK